LIEPLAWDSKVFGAAIGRVIDALRVPTADECRSYEHISVKVPQQNVGLVQAYERLGFCFVTVDYTLRRYAVPLPGEPGRVSIRRISKTSPDFAVSGFSMSGSRLELDPALKARMPPGFWDAMICDHCSEFADFCLCAVEEGRLEGFVSCFERHDAIDLFLIAVRPSAAGRGIGSALLHAAIEAAAISSKELTTNVVSQNVAAMRFYIKHGFVPLTGDVVLHYSQI
jgi:ribosomal protein S18 acetylase RimI-like enzyme